MSPIKQQNAKTCFFPILRCFFKIVLFIFVMLRGGNKQLKQRCFIFFVLLFHFHEEYYIDEINIMTSSYTRGRFLLLRGKSFSFTSRKNSRTERLTDKNVNACLSCSWFGNNAAPTEQFFSAAQQLAPRRAPTFRTLQRTKSIGCKTFL